MPRSLGLGVGLTKGRGRTPSPAMAITSIASTASTSSTLSVNGTYTVAAPSNVTGLWNAGAIASVVTGFSASGGNWSATFSTPSSPGTYTLTVTGTGSNTSSSTAGNTTAVSASSAFPGQAGNLVGYANAPGYLGSLTPHATTGFVSGTADARRVYSFLDIDAGSSGTTFGAGLDYIDFYGCRFQSNLTDYYNVGVVGGTNIRFYYCSFTPRATFYTSPPGYTWPSAGAGVHSTTFVDDVNCVPFSKGYQYGIFCSTGPGLIDHCDIWGGANLVDFHCDGWTLQESHLHDARNDAGTDHTDGVGYLNGGTPPHNITVDHNTIASLGNANGVAFQAATSAYVGLSITHNFISGFGLSLDPGHGATGNSGNVTVTDNTFGTHVPAFFGPVYADFSSQFTAATWQRNVFSVLAGTTPMAGSSLAWTSGDNGKFVLPSDTLSVTDFT